MPTAKLWSKFRLGIFGQLAVGNTGRFLGMKAVRLKQRASPKKKNLTLTLSFPGEGTAIVNSCFLGDPIGKSSVWFKPKDWKRFPLFWEGEGRGEVGYLFFANTLRIYHYGVSGRTACTR